LHHHDTFAT